MKKILKNESGQSLALFACALVALIGFTALTVDFGYPAFISARVQNAADSAAYAGATELPASMSEWWRVEEVAKEYAEKNGYDRAEVKVEAGMYNSSDGQYYQVKVTIDHYVDYYFAQIFGYNGVTISKSASVSLMPFAGLKDTVPLSIREDDFLSYLSKGKTYMELKVGGGSGENGAYGAIDSSDSGTSSADLYRKLFINGYSGILRVGDYRGTANGNMSGPTEEGIVARYNACHHFEGSGGCTPSHFDPECPRIMFVPVVEYTASNTVLIKGFAPFLIDGTYTGSGNESFVYGTYLSDLVLDPSSGVISDLAAASPYGPYAYKLAE